ncbi:MAG: TetR/AcrR family transcriptional regulator [Proteiniphilum sp.]|nr:TetR/AcrR family transcriptional regulator [Proteiniphilum sp.]
MTVIVKSKKYWDIINASRDLFWKHGFRRVTILEICGKAGVSKMTFYKYFPNKIDLAKTVFANEVEKGMTRFNELMEEDIPADEKIKGMVLLKAEGTHEISHEFLEDFYLDSEPELKRYVEEKTGEAWTRLLLDWKNAQEKGIFRDDFKPEFLLRVSYKIQELLKDEELAAMYDSTQDFILEFTRFVAYGISKR